MEHLVGQTLNRYQIISLLGKGGMGAVFKGRDVTLQRDVAIKVMHPQFAIQSDFQQRFLQEARTAARMSHPGVVQVYDFGQVQDQLYIVMEFIQGSNLGKILEELRKRGQWIVQKEALQVVKAVAQALDYAHRQGVLHRDIKPENIMLKPEPSEGLPYRPVVTDLGLAKLAGGAALTQQGVSMGTPPYMSPEQASGEKLTAQSDVYSLGVLLFELCTGQLPFPARTIADAIEYHTKQAPPAPRSIKPDLSPALEAVILKTLEKDPARRYADAASMAKALDEILNPPAAPAAPAAPLAAQPAPAKPEPPSGQVSLVTQFEGGLQDRRGVSVFQDMRAAPEDGVLRSQDRVQVVGRDKSARTYPIKPGTFTMGRGTENDIVLDDTQASRRHAKIEFDGKYYRIVDMNSTNGTFMDDAKLLPGVPEPWTSDKVLRVGDTYLRLFRANEELVKPSPPAGPSPGTRVDAPAPPPKPSEMSRIGVSLDNTQYTVEPGRMILLSVLLSNQGPLVDHFKMAVEGIPADWVASLPPTVQLMPGSQQQVNLSIQPPRKPTSKAGVYPLTIRVTSRDNPGQTASAQAALTVTPFFNFTSNLHPQKVRAGRKARVTVENESNTPGKFNLNWQDRAVELDFNPLQGQVEVQEGQTGFAEFTAKPRSRRLIGGDVSHPITVQVGLAEVETPQVHSGEVISRALIPPWLPPLLILLCLALAALLGWGWWQQKQVADATATVVAALTATAGADQDSDSDGLSNSKEAELGTNPNLADTDGDGLNDGEEVNRFNTNPKDLDSDDDSLPDGEEVNVTKTSPTSKDSDNDGILDNIDVAPQALPTATLTPTVTPKPTEEPVVVCPDAFPSFLRVGIIAKVDEDPPVSNNVRKDAGVDNERLGSIAPGEQVRILEGPKCVDGWVWWRIKSLKSGLEGWTSEGDGAIYWVVPLE